MISGLSPLNFQAKWFIRYNLNPTAFPVPQAMMPRSGRIAFVD